jgi:CYTH domain-containing protein
MEIERKFLVVADQRPPLPQGTRIEQGYLVFQNPPEVPVELRLRRVDEADCFLTVKSGLAERLPVTRVTPMPNWPVESMMWEKAGAVGSANTPSSNASA